LGALRKAEKPLSTEEVTAAVVQELQFGPDAARGLLNRVRANLGYLARVRGTVTKIGSRRGSKWGLKDK